MLFLEYTFPGFLMLYWLGGRHSSMSGILAAFELPWLHSNLSDFNSVYSCLLEGICPKIIFAKFRTDLGHNGMNTIKNVLQTHLITTCKLLQNCKWHQNEDFVVTTHKCANAYNGLIFDLGNVTEKYKLK